jgi:hypothetical protein
MNDVARRVVIEVLERHLGPVTELHRWSWRPVPFGACVRCRWPSHTLAPNGAPFHAFCWGNPDPVSSFEEWMRRKDGVGEWGGPPPERAELGPDRQWCATGRHWFDPTPDRLAACVEHAAAMVARWWP